MIELHEGLDAGIAYLEAVPTGQRAVPLPTLIVLHSFGASKELVTYFGLMGAQRGLRVILPDAPCHGARATDPDGRARQFWHIICDYVDQVARLHEALSSRLGDQSQISLAGTSMGAFAALAAAARYEFVIATAAYMGTAYFQDAARTIFPPLGRWAPELAVDHTRSLMRLADYDPSGHLDALAAKPIYLWHGARDDVVPFAESLRLSADLAQHGAANVRLEIDPSGSHRVTDAAARNGIDFLAQALAV